MSWRRSLRFLLQIGDKGLETANRAVLNLIHGVARKAEV